jgi:hypothetical protein
MPYSPTTWVSGTTPASAPNMNNIEGGVSGAFTQLESITANDAATLPSSDGPFTLANFISYIATVIRSITGAANWYDTPAATLSGLNTNKAPLASPTFTGTVTAAALNTTGALTKASSPVIYGASGLTGKFTANVSAPGSPADGDLWLDLSTVLG